MVKFKNFQDILYPVGITVEQSSNEGDSRTVATGKGPVIYGERKEHVLIVNRARSADKVFESANYEEIKKSTQQKIDKQRVGCDGYESMASVEGEGK